VVVMTVGTAEKDCLAIDGNIAFLYFDLAESNSMVDLLENLLIR
jgi:hypothetical protein